MLKKEIANQRKVQKWPIAVCYHQKAQQNKPNERKQSAHKNARREKQNRRVPFRVAEFALRNIPLEKRDQQVSGVSIAPRRNKPRVH